MLYEAMAKVAAQNQMIEQADGIIAKRVSSLFYITINRSLIRYYILIHESTYNGHNGTTATICAYTVIRNEHRAN